MIVMNTKMKHFFYNKKYVNLPTGLFHLLQDGVLKDQGYFLFSRFHNIGDPIDKEVVIQRYMDDTGLECTVNKFHLEDYVEQPFNNFQEVANLSISFVDAFIDKWRESFKEPCVIILTMDLETEFSPDAVFRFHKKREGEFWLDVNDIEDDRFAVLVVEI